MKKIIITLIILVILLLVFGDRLSKLIFKPESQTRAEPIKSNNIVTNLDILDKVLIKCWYEHAIWTREYVIAVLNNFDYKDRTAEKLLQNQDDIGNVFRKYYGINIGNTITSLLKEHVLVLVAILSAVKNRNDNDVSDLMKKWYKNADKLADELNSINPLFSKSEAHKMVESHLKFVTEYMLAYYNHNWSNDMDAYQKDLDHLLILAQVISRNIKIQFTNEIKVSKETHVEIDDIGLALHKQPNINSS